jgi:hypothetical protein
LEYYRHDWEDAFSLIMEASDQAPHLEYLARIREDEDTHWKRIDGEWVICDKEEFPSLE